MAFLCRQWAKRREKRSEAEKAALLFIAASLDKMAVLPDCRISWHDSHLSGLQRGTMDRAPMTIPGGSEREIPGAWVEAVTQIADTRGLSDFHVPDAVSIIKALRPLIEAETRERCAVIADGHAAHQEELALTSSGRLISESEHLQAGYMAQRIASALRAEGK